MNTKFVFIIQSLCCRIYESEVCIYARDIEDNFSVFVLHPQVPL